MSPPTLSPSETGPLSLMLYGALVLGLVGVLLALSSFLGQRRPTPEKDRAYESGIAPTGPALLARPVPFHLVAMFFLVFDVEVVFIVSWAVAYDTLGWVGWLEMAGFVGVLLVGLFYVWRKGALDWSPGREP